MHENSSRDGHFRCMGAMAVGAIIAFVCTLIGFSIGYSCGKPDIIRTNAEKKLSQIHKFIETE